MSGHTSPLMARSIEATEKAAHALYLHSPPGMTAPRDEWDTMGEELRNHWRDIASLAINVYLEHMKRT